MQKKAQYGDRTRDYRIKSPMLYQTELTGQFYEENFDSVEELCMWGLRGYKYVRPI